MGQKRIKLFILEKNSTPLRLFLLIVLLSFFVSGQQLPPIQNFTPLAYNGENQNWAIAQGSDAYIYMANNHYLQVFNGVSWQTYKSPNASIFRSVCTKGDLVFTGEYMEFGFWKRDSFGTMVYSSISEKLQEPMIEDEEFWSIITLDDWVLFSSLDRIYSYHLKTGEYTILNVKSAKGHIFKVDDIVYFQDQDAGVFRIVNGKPELVISSDRLHNVNVAGIYKGDDYLFAVLENAEFIKITPNGAMPWLLPDRELLKGLNVYTTAKLKDGSIVLGTISKGIYHLDQNGKLLTVFDQSKGLNNNTVLSIFQDTDDNLWLGLDNGISVLNMNSPFKEYIDNSGRLGLVYASKLFRDNLYVGTNQGLFVKPHKQDVEFTLITGTEGQVWFLNDINGTLFCGHNKGTFVIDEANAQLVSKLPGTWSVKPIKGNSNLLLQGNFDGLSVLKKENNKWTFSNKISGFDISSRFFEVLDNNEILVNHEYKGLFDLKLDHGYTKVEHIDTHPIMGYGSSIVKYNGKIIYSSLDGVFEKKDDSLVFAPDTTLIDLFFKEAGGISSIMLPDPESKRLWCFTKQGLSYVNPQSFSSNLLLTTIPIPAFFRRSLGVSGFENLSKIEKDKYVIGISNGFVELDLSKTKEPAYAINLTSVTSSNGLGDTKKMALTTGQKLAYDQNSISFNYAVPQYDKYSEVKYQYRLSGLLEAWSAWSTTPDQTFTNLNFGDYTFEVRAKVGNTLTTTISNYSFTVKRPWYLSLPALAIYIIALFAIFYGLHKAYKSYYTQRQNRIVSIEKKKLKRRKLKTEKELIQVKNEKLKNEIEAKNRELAVATMTMIKKNEFLSSIKTQLSNVENLTQIKAVIKTINKNINTADDWKFFEEAFNNADKDFLKRIKKTHPDLTPNDLKLCAYLRLNLSSKEIAPLLNISVRSVEVKRYRLRKKMNLPRENSLTKYILEL